MSEAIRAILRWVPENKGGRRFVPADVPYSTVARFEDDDHWPREAWSLVVRIERTYRDGRVTLANIEFLVDSAPSNLLNSGSRFELMEGGRRVAKGIVLSDSAAVPEEINEFEAELIG
jgi:hypothetical protein